MTIAASTRRSIAGCWFKEMVGILSELQCKEMCCTARAKPDATHAAARSRRTVDKAGTSRLLRSRFVGSEKGCVTDSSRQHTLHLPWWHRCPARARAFLEPVTRQRRLTPRASPSAFSCTFCKEAVSPPSTFSTAAATFAPPSSLLAFAVVLSASSS